MNNKKDKSKNENEKEINISQDNYKKPKVTKRQQLTKEDIIKLLENYEEVEDISDVPLNTHVRVQH